MIKYALRNIKSKPLRAIGIIISIALVVAMIFCMLSIKSAIYEYIYASETSSKGSSDILITTKSNSSRITEVSDPLKAVDGVDEIIPSFTVYALLNGEYIQVRGYGEGKLDSLQPINIVIKDDVSIRDDDVIISSSCAKHFSLNVGDKITLSLGKHSADFYIWGIAEDDGYFLSDSPYQFIGRIRQISKLVAGVESDGICNEIYIKIKDGYDANNVIEEIEKIPTYSSLQVSLSKDEPYIAQQTSSLTAPIVLAGGAVLALGIVFIVILFMMSAQEKIAQIAKYTVVGATKNQIFSMFIIESIIYAFIGSIVGSLLAVGLFVALLKITLSSLLVFSVSALKLFAAAVIGFITTIVSSLVPMLKAFKGTIRDNQLVLDNKSIIKLLLPIISGVLLIISIVIEFFVPSVKAVFAIITIVLALIFIGIIASYVLKLLGRNLAKLSNPEIKYSSIGVSREKRFAKSTTLLTLGMTVSMMLFMSWSLTTNIFDGYIDNFSNMIFVTNIQSSTNVEDFKEVELVDNATKMVWTKAELSSSSFSKTMNILGSKDALDMIEFKYITDESIVKSVILSNEPYVLVDKALNELYSVNVGDRLTLDIDGIKNEVIVGGILQHELFSGNYIVISAENIKYYFDKDVDTILVTTSSSTTDCANNLRTAFADKNYYAVEVLEAYKWDRDSMQAVFSLIGTLAVVVAIFIFVVTVASSLIGRNTAEKERVAMLSCGMSKKSLLRVEILQSILVALVSFVISFIASILITSSLIHALRLFGLYFEFMYETWVVAVCGLVMTLLYALVPVAMNFKKNYNIKKL